MSRALAGTVVVAAAALVGGCFADAPVDDIAAVGEPAGTFRVPVPDDLAPFATYEVDEAAFEIVDGTLSVSFRLPEGLLGFAASATFTGPVVGGEAAVSGPMGHGTCRVDSGVECALAYRADAADVAAVQAHWTARGDAFVDARVQVASLFADDPHGVLRLSIE